MDINQKFYGMPTADTPIVSKELTHTINDMRDMRLEVLAISKVSKLEGPIKKDEEKEIDDPGKILEGIKRQLSTPVIERKEDIEGILNRKYALEKSDEAIKMALKKSKDNKR